MPDRHSVDRLSYCHVEMAGTMSFGKAAVGAFALVWTLGALAVAPLQASQSVDPCYRKCVMQQAWGSTRKFACLRVCNRTIPRNRHAPELSPRAVQSNGAGAFGACRSAEPPIGASRRSN